MDYGGTGGTTCNIENRGAAAIRLLRLDFPNYYSSTQTFIEFYSNGTRQGYIYDSSSSGGSGLTLSNVSDVRLKEDIEDHPRAGKWLSALRQLQLRQWRDVRSSQVNRGWVAQEVHQVYPEAVYVPDLEELAGDSTDPVPLEDQAWGVAPLEFIPLLMGACQQLDAENAALKTRLDAIEATLAQLQRQEDP